MWDGAHGRMQVLTQEPDHMQADAAMRIQSILRTGTSIEAKQICTCRWNGRRLVKVAGETCDARILCEDAAHEQVQPGRVWGVFPQFILCVFIADVVAHSDKFLVDQVQAVSVLQ